MKLFKNLYAFYLADKEESNLLSAAIMALVLFPFVVGLPLAFYAKGNGFDLLAQSIALPILGYLFLAFSFFSFYDDVKKSYAKKKEKGKELIRVRAEKTLQEKGQLSLQNSPTGFLSIVEANPIDDPFT